MLGIAARYHLAAVGRCHDDAHPDSLALYARSDRVRPDFVKRIFSKLPRTSHVSPKVLKMFPVFFVYFMGVRVSSGGWCIHIFQ
jgi:hypothetical protein